MAPQSAHHLAASLNNLRIHNPNSISPPAAPQAAQARVSHMDWIAAITWHPESGHHLATASHDTTVKLWDTRAAVPLHTITGHTDKVIKLNLHQPIVP